VQLSNKVKKEVTSQKAIDMLGNFAYRGQRPNGFLLVDRVKTLVDFIEQHPTEQVEILINNSHKPPKPRTLKHYVKVGSNTFSYAIWAVIR